MKQYNFKVQTVLNLLLNFKVLVFLVYEKLKLNKVLKTPGVAPNADGTR